MRLECKNALITGGGSGIGRAVALLFAREGARVAVAGRREARLAETAQMVRAAGGEALEAPGDVSREEDVERMVRQALDAWGRLDILVNNAGIMIRRDTLGTTGEEWDRTMDVNLKGVFLMCRQVIPVMVRAGGGAIANVASVVGLSIAQSDAHAYSASKGAVVTLTRALALSHGPQNIRVNAVCPSMIETEMPLSMLKEGESWQSRAAALAERFPLRRLGRPEDVAHACLYLCSEEASWVTGTALVVDGGRTAGA